MPGNQANLGFWTAPPKRLSQAGDWFYPGEIAKAGVNVEKQCKASKARKLVFASLSRNHRHQRRQNAFLIKSIIYNQALKTPATGLTLLFLNCCSL